MGTWNENCQMFYSSSSFWSFLYLCLFYHSIAQNSNEKECWVKGLIVLKWRNQFECPDRLIARYGLTSTVYNQPQEGIYFILYLHIVFLYSIEEREEGSSSLEQWFPNWGPQSLGGPWGVPGGLQRVSRELQEVTVTCNL